jgi:hypothetical protein
MRLTLATEPAYPDRPNEDFIGATPDAVVLLDGAGTPADLESGCSHGVAWYSHTSGPEELITQVRKAEHSDPNGIRWQRGKIYDDATAALWRFR